MDAEVQLALNGFRYALLGEKFLIVPPDNIDREKGWMRDAVDYLCAEWNYTEEEQMKESLK
jgi:DNA mismatch repair protein MutH